jgi:hypothetical protein
MPGGRYDRGPFFSGEPESYGEIVTFPWAPADSHDREELRIHPSRPARESWVLCYFQ